MKAELEERREPDPEIMKQVQVLRLEHGKLPCAHDEVSVSVSLSALLMSLTCRVNNSYSPTGMSCVSASQHGSIFLPVMTGIKNF